MNPKKLDSPDGDARPGDWSGAAIANRRILWALLAAALAWGIILSIGALLKDTLRGLIALGFVALFALFWTWLLVRLARKRSSPSQETRVRPSKNSEG